MEALHTLLPVIILLFAGVLAIALTRPLRMSPIIGYLIAGMIIGTHGFGWIEADHTTHLLAELGVVFLLFDIGLHFSLGHIWDARKDILGLGPLQIILCTAAFAIIAIMIGLEVDIAIIIGTTLALSSTAVVAQILADQQQQHCPVAVSATAVLIFQDICAIFLLILVHSMEDPNTELGSVIGYAALKALAAFVAAMLIGRYLIGPLFKLIAKLKDNEIFTAFALLIVLATAAATGVLGLSLTLGAFLAGMIISETPYRHLIQTEITPFRGLLLGFFFITVGMALDTQVIISQWWKIISVAILLMLIKMLFIYISARVLKMPKSNAFSMGILLAQGSEFAFVIFAMPALQNALGSEKASILIIAVAGSMVLTPVAVALGKKISQYQADKNWQEELSPTAIPEKKEAAVIIIGMSEVGQRIADGLNNYGITYRGIEYNHDCFVGACTKGYLVGFGDATDLRLMDAIKFSHAEAIVVTFADYNIAKELAPIVKERYPNLALLVSVKNEDEREQFSALGMQAIIEQSFPRGLDIAVTVLSKYGIESDQIKKWMLRQQENELLSKGDQNLTNSDKQMQII
ncbi:MAG TPA: potassium transporter KefB [Leucothrix mucor]|nr:potassium transporter KefB [Leucothrix mucor]